jgi:NAD(P)-dependent dehydrogenase (short-subunit alcohol dehydrogenase family)
MTMPPGTLSGRTVLVTGAAGGIGLETAAALANLGAHVVLAARSEARGAPALGRIRREGGSAELLSMDLGAFASIREAAERFSSACARLDVLVHNAGVATRRREVTPDGHERIWQTNFLAPFLLTRLCMPLLEASPAPRIVNVASEAHRSARFDWKDPELERGFAGFRAYANSKLALILWTRELARRKPAIAVNAVHPGVIATGIWRAVPAPGRWLLAAVLPSAKTGARPLVRLAADPALAGVTGRYFDKLREARPSAAACDDRAAARLWEIAEEAVGPDSAPSTGGGRPR